MIEHKGLPWVCTLARCKIAGGIRQLGCGQTVGRSASMCPPPEGSGGTAVVRMVSDCVLRRVACVCPLPEVSEGTAMVRMLSEHVLRRVGSMCPDYLLARALGSMDSV